MVELKEKSEILEETQRVFTQLCNDVILPRNKEEESFLHAFRKLNATNKIEIAAKIEGMLAAQMYAQTLKE